jgi:hypothetical protein
MPVMRDSLGRWLYDPANQVTSRKIRPNAEMLRMKKRWAKAHPNG